MKTLIVYPHGLGDCILATPAIRQYKKQTGDFIGFATLERFRSAELFKNNPYVDEVIYTKDAWNDFPDFQCGIDFVLTCCHLHALKNNYDKTVLIQHSPTGSKILDCFAVLEIPHNDDLHTEVYLVDEDHEWAKDHQREVVPIPLGYNDKVFGFIHSKTGVPNKDLPEDYGRKWLLKNFHITTIEVDKIEPITHGFALMKRASAVCVTDSVYYHAAGAMDKDVDLAYFARGIGTYNRVRPLHPVKQNIVYLLEPL